MSRTGGIFFVFFRKMVREGDTQLIDGGKLELPEAESHEWCLPPELLGELLELGFFLNGFAPLLELRGGAGAVPIRELDTPVLDTLSLER